MPFLLETFVWFGNVFFPALPIADHPNSNVVLVLINKVIVGNGGKSYVSNLQIGFFFDFSSGGIFK